MNLYESPKCFSNQKMFPNQNVFAIKVSFFELPNTFPNQKFVFKSKSFCNQIRDMIAESHWESMKSSPIQAPNQTCVFRCVLKGYTVCCGIEEKFFQSSWTFWITKLFFQSKSSQLNELFDDYAESKMFSNQIVFAINFRKRPERTFSIKMVIFIVFAIKGFSCNQIRKCPKPTTFWILNFIIERSVLVSFIYRRRAAVRNVFPLFHAWIMELG